MVFCGYQSRCAASSISTPAQPAHVVRVEQKCIANKQKARGFSGLTSLRIPAKLSLQLVTQYKTRQLHSQIPSKETAVVVGY
ncbi:unnamed protein product [Ceratitis capitata]|uniref:(Mediterranean fruit fly) hypothetical protein n=1 Tax=Ceratitis capitata TaxID=7213 RepID=A0A811VM32_CERCA|nr:unnamed protein product [Ceratitis capitata]